MEAPRLPPCFGFTCALEGHGTLKRCQGQEARAGGGTAKALPCRPYLVSDSIEQRLLCSMVAAMLIYADATTQ